MTIRFTQLWTQYLLVPSLHFHCLCYAHFEEFHWNPAMKITISLAQKVSGKLQSQHFLRSVQLVSWRPCIPQEQEVAPPLPSELSKSTGGVAAHPMQRSLRMVLREIVLLQMFSVAQSMGIATPKLTGKEELTSETATGSAMVFPCLQMS